MYYINPDIESLHRIFDQNQRHGYLRLDLNENPNGLPEEFVTDVLKDIDSEFVSQYPETAPFTQTLATFLGVDPSNLCLVNGSAEGIRYIIQAFTSINGRIVGVVPSYFMFQVYSEMYHREFVKVPYNDDLTMDVAHIINALTDDTELLILLNPNNPMGNTYSDKEFKLILAAAEAHHITILIDEAYHYYYPKTFINYALSKEHIFVTRTFSKLFSLAGCRLGYVVGRPDGIKIVQKLCTPHNTNAFAMRFAEAIIKHPLILDKLIADFAEGRSHLVSLLDKNSYLHQGEAGNFIFIKPHTDADVIVKRMKDEKRILIKSYANVGKLGNCLRISIGNKATMQTFFDALIDIDR